MNSADFLRRERQLARRYGLRKSDVLFQMVRCRACGAEALLRSRFNRFEFTSLAAAEARVLDVIRRPVSARCAECGGVDMDGAGSRHVFLMYAERARAHLALTLRMTREDDGRVKVRRQVWFVPDDGDATEIEVEDERLDDFWRDSRIRFHAARADPELAAKDLEALARQLPGDPYVLREIGNSLVDAGRTARALEAYERSLAARQDQPSTLSKAARLHAAFGNLDVASEMLERAFELTGDTSLLNEVVRTTYRSRRLDALASVAARILADDPDSVIARKALAVTHSVDDVGAMRDAWRWLRDTAIRAGDKGTEHVAAFWTTTLGLPLPDWSARMTRADYVAALRDELASWNVDVVDDPDPLVLGDAEIPVDVEATTPEGDSLLFVVFDQLPTAALEQRIAATVRAARDDARRAPARLVPLCREPLTWAAMAWASGAPDAELLLAADADTTMTVVDENIAAFALSAERHFGRTLDFDLDSLAEVDAILDRLHDGGFGEITYAFQCQVAAYIGAVIGSLVEGASWQQQDPPMDPRVLVLPTGEEINLVSKVGKAVRNGAEDGIAHFVSVLLEHAGGTP